MQRTEIPDDLAVLPPGAGLAAAIGAIELPGVPNDRIIEVARAQYRQLCHEQARMSGVLAELGRCAGFADPGEVSRLPEPERFASEEIRAALCWTRRAAEGEHDLAEAVVSLWPMVFAAWLAGDIDRPRVRVFERYLTGLNEVQVDGVCRIAVPKASCLTTGQLGALLRRMVIAVDPDAAARWYRKAVAERNVVAYAAADGTVTMSANGLPADEAEAACIRLQELASKAKRAGHPGLIGQIRCDLFLGMLDGRFHHLTTPQVIALLLADCRAAEARNAADTEHPGSSESPECADGDRSDEPYTEAEGGAGAEAEGGAGAEAEGGAGAEAEGGAGAEAEGGAGAGAEGGAGAEAEGGAGAEAEGRAGVKDVSGSEDGTGVVPEPGVEPGPARDERIGIEIRVGLATLLGLDEHPAEIPGLGLLPAPEARRRIAIQGRAEWRFALTDADGSLVFDGITRRRPRHIRRDGPPGGIVELHIPLSLLAESPSDGPGADWAALVADIAAQHAVGGDQRRDLDSRPGARLPGAALRRHTEIRDRTCTFMGCRRRAHAADQDHTRDYERGGATVRANLGALCPHDHQVKHLGGWRVEQPEPGTFVWRSPLGGEYRTRAESILPRMPDPVRTMTPPADDLAAPGPALDASTVRPAGPILCRSTVASVPDEPRHRPLPRADPDEPPPF